MGICKKESEVNGYARRKDDPAPKKYALSFIVVGAVLAVLGVILNFVLDPKATFDLPWFILGIGVIAVVYGIVQMTRGERLHPEVSFPPEQRKTF